MSRYPEPHWRVQQEAAFADAVAQIHRKQLEAKTPGQAVYLDNLSKKKVTVCLGPAGTGKSFCAAGRACHLLATKQVEKIVLTRPLVQCGQGYGFLPGEKSEKIAPFFRPLIDCMREFMTASEYNRRLADGTIELLPLEDMRGTTLKGTFLICDEAQNAHYHQLHMLLTRFGPGSKFVVCGDVSRTQVDILHRGVTPLSEVVRRIEGRGGNPSIGVVRLTRKDIVREGLVQWLDEALGEEKVEAWYKFKCPGCAEQAWYSNGDESDLTTTDVDAVKCWNCGAAVSLFDKQDEFSPFISPSLDALLEKSYKERP